MGRWLQLDREGRFRVLFGGSWLLFMGFSVASLFDGHHAPGIVARDLAALCVLAGIVLWFLLAGPSWSGLRWRLPALAAATALAAGLTLAEGGSWGYDFIYCAMLAGWVSLDRRYSGVAVAAITVVTVLIAVTARQSPAYVLSLGLDVALVGLGTASVGQLVRINRELRQAREEVARLAVAEERLRFARDLHDLLGHSLSVVVLKAELASRMAASAPERAAEQARDIEQVARQALREVREAVAGYRQPSLSQELERGRAALAETGVSVLVEQAGGPLPAPTDAVLAWALREGFTNVLRHSRAREVRVRVWQEGSLAGVELMDDGPALEGFSPGNGLLGVRERARARGGWAEFGPGPKGGFRLTVGLPVAPGPGARPAVETPDGPQSKAEGGFSLAKPRPGGP